MNFKKLLALKFSVFLYYLSSRLLMHCRCGQTKPKLRNLLCPTSTILPCLLPHPWWRLNYPHLSIGYDSNVQGSSTIFTPSPLSTTSTVHHHEVPIHLSVAAQIQYYLPPFPHPEVSHASVSILMHRSNYCFIHSVNHKVFVFSWNSPVYLSQEPNTLICISYSIKFPVCTAFLLLP